MHCCIEPDLTSVGHQFNGSICHQNDNRLQNTTLNKYSIIHTHLIIEEESNLRRNRKVSNYNKYITSSTNKQNQ